MLVTVKKSEVNGQIKAPASKSIMQRLVALSTASRENMIINNPSYCADSLAALEIAKTAGAEIKKTNEQCIIKQQASSKQLTFDCSESGLCMRMFPSVLSLSGNRSTIDGDPSLRKRPIDMIEKPLQQLGVTCRSYNGFLPIKLEGKLTGGTAEVDGSISSQFITGLLIALPFAPDDSTIHVNNPTSLPYIDLTLRILSDFGINIEHKDYKVFQIKGGQELKRNTYTVEGDWSGAAFMLVAGAIAGNVSVTGLLEDSTQGDKKIIQALIDAGADLQIKDSIVYVKKNKLRSFSFDATDCPDLFPPLVALASGCEGITEIIGVDRLKHKESDRGAVLLAEFSKLGVDIRIDGNLMTIKGGTITGGVIDSHGDHRIAMAGAIAGLISEKYVKIQGAECVSKSYPEFFEDLKSTGGVIDE